MASLSGEDENIDLDSLLEGLEYEPAPYVESDDFGHPISNRFGTGWKYSDTGESVDDNPRPCVSCGQYKTVEGHDPCIQNLPSIRHACCGHGLRERGHGYLGLHDGRCLYFGSKSGEEIREILALALANKPLPEDVTQAPDLAWWAGMTDEEYQKAWQSLF